MKQKKRERVTTLPFIWKVVRLQSQTRPENDEDAKICEDMTVLV